MDSFVRLLSEHHQPDLSLKPRLLGTWKKRQHGTKRQTDGTYLMWIRSGEGLLQIHAQTYAIASPCIMLLPPRTKVAYQPTSSWDEYYAIYSDDCHAVLQDLFGNRHVIPIFVSPLLDRIFSEWHGLDFAVGSDTQRALATLNLMLHESARCTRLIDDPLAEPIAHLRELINHNPAMELEPEAWAKDAGVSRSTWERAWRRLVKDPPGVYHNIRRMELAASLLETHPGKRISEIAQLCGFDDPTYFSRRFVKWSGITPRAYQQQAGRLK